VRAGGDQTLNHLLGRWCYAVASVSWMERKLASAIFATPPESSYDEALKVSFLFLFSPFSSLL
jgi:hypothetical protein